MFIAGEAREIGFSLVAFCKSWHSWKNVEMWILNLNTMKKIILFISIFSLLACSQNRLDEPVLQDAFIDNALSILDELGNYYPP